jgi:hypothetical protein
MPWLHPVSAAQTPGCGKSTADEFRMRFEVFPESRVASRQRKRQKRYGAGIRQTTCACAVASIPLALRS